MDNAYHWFLAYVLTVGVVLAVMVAADAWLRNADRRIDELVEEALDTCDDCGGRVDADDMAPSTCAAHRLCVACDEDNHCRDCAAERAFDLDYARLDTSWRQINSEIYGDFS